jgi:type I restriction enzyme, S subunit
MNMFRLKDVMEFNSIKTGPFGSDLKVSDYISNGKYKVYTQENIISNNFSIGDKYITEEKYNQLKSCKINSGEILVSTRGTLGVFSLLNNKSYEQGIIHSSVIKFKLKKNKSNSFFLYQLNYLPHIKQYIMTNSSVNAIPALYSRDIKEITIYNPSLENQNKIANYLDTETSKIDRKISILEQKFEKLEEYKQSVIFETVTKGLDFNIGMKDSGIDWIGDIPAHWEVKRIKDIAKVATGQTPPREDLECFSDNFEHNVLWIKPEDLAENREISESFEYITPKGLNYIKVYKPNSIILSGIGDVGKIGLSKYLFTTNQQNHILYNCTVNYKYLFYFLKSAKKDLEQKSSGTVVPILNANKLKKIFCPYPLKEEQEKIVQFLNELSSKIDKKTKIIKKQIELLKEYKQTIIYEAVTGQMEIL